MRDGLRFAAHGIAAHGRGLARAALRRGLGLVLVLGVVLAVQAQDAAAPVAQAPPVYSSAQLDQMLAPIALYPDDLLGQILMAATYPLEIVEADRWLQNPANTNLHGTELAQALQQQSWDASVKSLVAFPQVLSILDNNLQWTEELGEAFLVQQAEVMDHIQQLRSRALAARTLNSTPQQTVVSSDQGIEIAPAMPDTVYVPVYDPDLVYGDWPYPDYLPYYFDFAGFPLGSFVGFTIVAPLWGWNHWDWNHHRLNIGGGGSFAVGGPVLPLRPGPWHYDPQRRGGVPFRSGAAQAHFAGPQERSIQRESFRGYVAPMTTPALPSMPAPRAAATAPAARPLTMPETPRLEEPGAAMRMPERVAPPAMESFGSGEQVRIQEQRGASSRMSMPATHGGGGRSPR